jgi:hypothetical protein
MIGKHLLTKNARRAFTVPVLETKAETVDASEVHLHSAYQAIKTGKYKEQRPNIRKSNTRSLPANPVVRDD